MAQSEPEVSVDQATSTELALKRPTLFDVVFFNDKKTHYEFVVLVLMHLFGKDYETATELTGYIHEKGRAVVATYTYEIAATKRDETVATARANGHPLKVEIEPSQAESGA